MRNFIHPGDVNSYVAPYALASGGGFKVGSDFAVALTDAAIGATVEGMVVGVFDLPKGTAAGTGATQGAKAYWDDANKAVTKTAGANLLIGTFRRDCADADVTCRVRVTGQVS